MTDSYSIAAAVQRSGFGRLIAGVQAAVAIMLLMLAVPALAQEAPDALVKRVSQEALQIIKTDPKVQAGDQARIRELIETKLTPHFDIDRMTALAAGRAYRSATPEQKKRLGEEFKTLLIRTYSSALNQYRDQTIEYKPLRMDPAATDTVVRTEVVRPGQPPVQIDYSMGKTPEGWKAYDVIVGGVSLVTNYRDEFTQQVQAGGVDGLIKSLAAKNAGGSGK
ncbi:MAG TPA: ABC transporter substrate-binding protein [Casimicrobiaceae bacterium]|nr:ABC transporter substrate-binding protein [Casimicrobiaceae bacterium]